MQPEHPELLFRAWEAGDGEYLHTLNADPRVASMDRGFAV